MTEGYTTDTAGNSKDHSIGAGVPAGIATDPAGTQHEPANIAPANVPDISQWPRSVHQQLKSSSVINLSKKRTLTKAEISVLEFGLTFCPSVKEFNKERLADDCFHFIRKLKLKEYFARTHDETTERDEHPQDPDRAASKWKQSNPDFFPDEVRNNTSTGLQWYIDQFLACCSNSISRKSESVNNNLTPQQRQALQDLAADKSIIIKPSDKCGKIVIMDVEDYDKACLETLTNSEHYLELKEDPNPQYKEQLMEEIRSLKANNYINKFEESMLIEGSRTPAFYGLPKLHKAFSNFPALRPISSGSSSCTKRLSEFIDTFLKPLAQKLPSYVQDTTSFINKVRTQKFSGPTYVSSLDVTSLYPNIDHTEGSQACEELLDTRAHKSIPTALLKHLITLILRLNTICFGGRFFQQIKGTAMGTPMAVNYANCFMGKFEQELLSSYEEQHGKRPALWLRFIDDVFVVWQGTIEEFNHFIRFCDEFATSKKLKSNIRFTSSPPSKSAEFLDTRVLVNDDGTLSTDLYTKPTASHQYLHRNSYHTKHVTSSLPKSQFMRIRRICSRVSDYDRHANAFMEYFMKRNYHKKQLTRMIQEVRQMKREELLTYKKRTETCDRIPLVLTYHHKFEGIGSAIKDAYNRSIAKFPELKSLFPQPPMVAFRRTRNIRDKVIRANHHKRPPCDQVSPSQGHGRSQLAQCINPSQTITNHKTNRTCRIEGGPATTKGAIYAAECTKHKLLYIGQTERTLSSRFNNHRSDVGHQPHVCKLTEHFSRNGCSFQTDLRVSVLEQVSGSRALREYKEDRWITRLQTVAPNGMNATYATDFGPTYAKLFQQP